MAITVPHGTGMDAAIVMCDTIVGARRGRSGDSYVGFASEMVGPRRIRVGVRE